MPTAWLGALLSTALVVGPAPEGTRRATLSVDTSQVGEAGPIIRRRTEERGAIVLRDAGVLSGETIDDPLIRVDVFEIGGEDPGFRLEVWVEEDGTITVPKRTIDCALCTETEIVAKAETEIAALVRELPARDDAAAEPTPAAEPEPAAGDPTQDTTTSEPTDPSDPSGPSGDGARRPLGAKGKAGIGLLATGAVVAGVGIALAVPGWEPLDDDPTRERSTRPIGIGLIAGGSAALIGGAVLLALDRRPMKGQRASVQPVVGWRSVGLVGRF